MIKYYWPSTIQVPFMITKVYFIIVIVVAARQKSMIFTFEVKTSVQTDLKIHKTTDQNNPYTLVLSFNIIPLNEEFNKVEHLHCWP